jgi:hypothetical protein
MQNTTGTVRLHFPHKILLFVVQLIIQSIMQLTLFCMSYPPHYFPGFFEWPWLALISETIIKPLSPPIFSTHTTIPLESPLPLRPQKPDYPPGVSVSGSSAQTAPSWSLSAAVSVLASQSRPPYLPFKPSAQ